MSGELSSFKDRLIEEIEYHGISKTDFAEKVGISLGTLNMYLYRNSIPSADIAVKLAKVLNTTVEYLVTGEQKDNLSMQNSIKPKIERDLESCSDETQNFLSTAVHLFAEYEKNQKK